MSGTNIPQCQETTEHNLDALCDMLDEDDPCEEAEETPPLNIEHKEKSSNISSINNPLVQSKDTSLSNQSSVEALQSQMLEMKKQMMLMQQQLAEKNSEITNTTKVAAKENIAVNQVALTDNPCQISTPSNLKDVDIFSQSGCSSKSGPKSPVKTNPFAEGVDRVVKFQAKVFHETPKYGPALSKKTTRSLEKDEKAQLLKSLSEKDREKKDNSGVSSHQLASRDLELSSDDTDGDEEGNPMYNAYGKDIKKRIAIESKQQMNPNHAILNRCKSTTGNISTDPALKRAKTVPSSGFDTLKGSTMNLSRASSNIRLPSDVITEKHSRIRISKPMVSQTQLDLGLVGRKMVPLHRIKTAITMRETEGDWTTMGVIYYKNSATSKNGNPYTRWSITDLIGDIQTVSVMLFGKAQAKYYSMPQNRVVGLLNPKILEDLSGKGEVSLSIDHPDKILEMGESVDVGKCAAKKNDGTGCTNLVNINSCEYCMFHVKKAYKAMSAQRGEIQSAFSGMSVRSRIMQKVAPKCEVFGGGQILNERQVHGKLSVKQKSRDNNTLERLGVSLQKSISSNPRDNPIHKALFFETDEKAKEQISKLNQLEKKAVKKVTSMSEDLGKKMLAPTPGSKALMRHLVNAENEKIENNLKRLSDSKSMTSEESTKRTAKDVKGMHLLSRDEEREHQKKRIKENQKGAQKLLSDHKLHKKQEGKGSNLEMPKLGRCFKSSDVLDLNSPNRKVKVMSADKVKALLALKGKSISKGDPNYVAKRKRTEDTIEQSKKRVALTLEQNSNDENEMVSKNIACTDSPNNSDKNVTKKVIRSFTGEIIDEKRMSELKNKKSTRSHLADEAEMQEEEYYFDKLQKKEAMEDKMISTKEIESKVITCSACNYTSFTQSEHCRNMGHNVKRITVQKRFFECKNCKNRTITLGNKYPKTSCDKCKQSAWERVGMMRERKGPALESEKLIIRGREESFVGATIKSSDLNVNSME